MMGKVIGALLMRFGLAAGGAWILGVYHAPPGSFWERVAIVYLAMAILIACVSSELPGE